MFVKVFLWDGYKRKSVFVVVVSELLLETGSNIPKFKDCSRQQEIVPET